MSEYDREKTRQANLARLIVEENTIEAEKRRNEARQATARKKREENDRLDSSRYKKDFEQNQRSNYRPPNQYWMSPEDRLVLEFYEARCADKIKKRSSIVFTNHLVVPETDGPPASSNVISELTKWVKIALSKKKFICSVCNNRTLPQRCSKECFFFSKTPGCLAGQLCHSRHGVPPDDIDNQNSKDPPLFLNK